MMREGDDELALALLVLARLTPAALLPASSGAGPAAVPTAPVLTGGTPMLEVGRAPGTVALGAALARPVATPFGPA